MNTPLMDIFVGIKEVIVQLIIGWFHNGKLYFATPIEINGNLINQIIGLSNKGEPIPIGPTPALVKELTGTPLGKYSRGLIVNQILYGTKKITTKIVSMALISM